MTSDILTNVGGQPSDPPEASTQGSWVVAGPPSSRPPWLRASPARILGGRKSVAQLASLRTLVQNKLKNVRGCILV